jgi:Ca2+-transporting ATPase
MSEIPSPALPFPGLSAAEAAKRLEQHGRNQLIRTSGWRRMREALSVFADPMALMLGAAAGVYFVLGDSRNGIILLLALVPVLAVDVALEARSRAALKKLASAVSPRTSVVRDGAILRVATEELVPGDVLLLSEGGMLHADGTVLFSANLAVDESALTGESEPQEKAVSSKFFAGSTVLTGHGFGEVQLTGEATAYGKIGALVESAPVESSPLQRKIHRMLRLLVIAAAVAAVAVVLVSLYRGISLGRALLAGISLGISAAPEEFLLVFTVFLTLGAWRLAQRGPFGGWPASRPSGRRPSSAPTRPERSRSAASPSRSTCRSRPPRRKMSSSWRRCWPASHIRPTCSNRTSSATAASTASTSGDCNANGR